MPGPLDYVPARGLPDPQHGHGFRRDELWYSWNLASTAIDYPLPGTAGRFDIPGAHGRGWAYVYWSIYANGCFKTQTVKLWRNGEVFYSTTVGQCGDSTSGLSCATSTPIPAAFAGGGFAWSVREINCQGAPYFGYSAKRLYFLPPARRIRTPAPFAPLWNGNLG